MKKKFPSLKQELVNKFVYLEEEIKCILDLEI